MVTRTANLVAFLRRPYAMPHGQPLLAGIGELVCKNIPPEKRRRNHEEILTFGRSGFAHRHRSIC